MNKPASPSARRRPKAGNTFRPTGRRHRGAPGSLVGAAVAARVH